MLKKIARLLNLKSLTAFALTFLLGIGTNFFTGNYWFYFTAAETFTRAEAEAKLNKRIAENCFNQSEPLQGTVVSYHRNNVDGRILIDIKWDKPLFGKHEKTSQGIDVYRHCTK